MRKISPQPFVLFLFLFVGLRSNAEPVGQADTATWGTGERQSQTLVADDHPAATLDADSSCTVLLWVRLEGDAKSFPALAANKSWEDGEIVDLISTSNMGITLSTGTGRGWALALQPNGSWHWNLGNGRQRLDYLPTAERQPINDGNWHLLAFTIDRTSNTARLYYDGKNVAIFAINGFGDLLSRLPSASRNWQSAD